MRMSRARSYKSIYKTDRYNDRMIKKVLLWTLVIFIIALIIFWFWSGGFAAVGRSAHTLINPVDLLWGKTASRTTLRLPWQPSEMVRGPDISGYATEVDTYQAMASVTA